MAITLELYDGTTTIDLTTGRYTLEDDSLFLGPSIPDEQVAGEVLVDTTYGPRELRATIIIDVASTEDEDDLKDNIRSLERMLQRAEERELRGKGTEVVLKYQINNTDTYDISTRVLRGDLEYPSNIFNLTTLTGSYAVSMDLRLVLAPFGELPIRKLSPIVLENEVDGTDLNYVDIAGPFLTAATFDGLTDKITVTDAASIRDYFATEDMMEARFKADSAGEGNLARIWDKEQGTTNGHRCYFSEVSGSTMKLNFDVGFDSVDGHWRTTNRVITFSREYHLAILYDGSSDSNAPTFYLIEVNDDGSLGTTQVLTVGAGLDEVGNPTGTIQSDSGNDLTIGNNSGQTRTFDGNIYMVAMWTASRTQAQIEASALDELQGDETNLGNLWPLNEGTGTAAHELVNGNTGTVDAGTSWTVADDVRGNTSALWRFKLEDQNRGGGNAWNSDTKLYQWLRPGEQKTDNQLTQAASTLAAGTSPIGAAIGAFSSGTTGGPTTNASGGASSFGRWTNNASDDTLNQFWVRTAVFSYNFAGANFPEGTYRVLARCSIDHNIADADMDITYCGFALGHQFGGLATVEPADGDEVRMPSDDKNWHTLDIGELTIPTHSLPDSADFSPATYVLRVNAVVDVPSGTTITVQQSTTPDEYIEWSVDYIILVDTRSCIIIDDIDTNDVLLSDTISKNAGVWVLNTSDVVQKFADPTGAPFEAGPESFRYHWAKGDTADPTTIQAKLHVSTVPRVMGI